MHGNCACGASFDGPPDLIGEPLTSTQGEGRRHAPLAVIPVSMFRTTIAGRGNTTRSMMVRILFYGDPHGNWKPLLKACADDQPDGVVILGDCDLVGRAHV